MHNSEKFQQSNDIELEIAEYRNKQRRRYLNQKKGVLKDDSVSCSGSFNKVDNSLSAGGINCSNSFKINCPSSSYSEAHENSNHEVNNPNPGENNEFNHNLAESLELDIGRDQPTIQRDKVHDMASELVGGSSSDYIVQNANSSLTDKIKMRKSKNSKKSTSNSSSGIISSLKSWTHSLITHSSKQSYQNRRQRSSRSMDAPINMETTITEDRGDISQIEHHDPDILHTNISDEELARRIQIEEFNSLGTIHVIEDSSIFPSYSLGTFQDANYYPNITFSSSNSIAISPFQGVPYKFEFRSSDDEQ
ncbi:uncharacterized protein ELE39_001179 [Cryptosporidium sp. chipmunk genotype I]|uniref:uncharacterized protein n=1 Tax=Cryptosporidium sp. chipmunk genotype I TaxID=1280935 RepID=UPI00351A9E7F|nr:hypothetical protein ELE39_001179 [Cryptosporidium sp. chipmunk genotype I]